MSDVSRRHHEDHVFGDVRRVVPDPLEMARDEDEIETGLDRHRILEHVGQELAEDLRLVVVESVVLVEDRLRQREVAAHVRIERPSKHRLSDLGHPRNVDQLLHRRSLQVPPRGLGDVHREVSDAFEIGVDLHRRDDGAQVGRDALAQREQLETAVVDFDVELIDRLVAGEHLVDEVDLTVHQAGDCEAQAFLGQATHDEQPLLELRELLLEVTNDAIGGFE